LVKMGMALAFTANADFSGMNGGREPLLISNVLHKAFVDVNEEGTEAAAATAVIVARGGPPPRPIVFRADHPFVYLIRDRRTGCILFMGRMANPKE
jgi:serpin B